MDFELDEDLKDILPRLSAAYDVFGDGRTALKASLGKYPLAQNTRGSELGVGPGARDVRDVGTRQQVAERVHRAVDEVGLLLEREPVTGRRRVAGAMAEGLALSLALLSLASTPAPQVVPQVVPRAVRVTRLVAEVRIVDGVASTTLRQTVRNDGPQPAEATWILPLPEGAVADFSCGGLNPEGGEVDLAAPGIDVFSSYPRPQMYRALSGTSMACPHVAGVAALWAEAEPSLRGQSLFERLKGAAAPLEAAARDAGSGLVQAPSGAGAPMVS